MLKLVLDGSEDAGEKMVSEEEEQGREKLKKKLEEFLVGEPELVRLLECRCQGMTDPAEIAKRWRPDEALVDQAPSESGTDGEREPGSTGFGVEGREG